MKEKREWDIWEKRIEAECKITGITVVRVPETIRGFYGGKPVKVKSNVDFSVGVDGRAAFFDAKVTNERLWNLKKYVFADTRIHQYAQLLSAHTNGNVAGYLIWFADYRKIVWLPVTEIEKLKNAGVASIHPETEGVLVQDEDQIIDLRKLLNLGVKT